MLFIKSFLNLAPFITPASFYLPDAYDLSNSSVINAEIMKDTLDFLKVIFNINIYRDAS